MSETDVNLIEVNLASRMGVCLGEEAYCIEPCPC